MTSPVRAMESEEAFPMAMSGVGVFVKVRVWVEVKVRVGVKVEVGV
jgi:hypothetical protein